MNGSLIPDKLKYEYCVLEKAARRFNNKFKFTLDVIYKRHFCNKLFVIEIDNLARNLLMIYYHIP